MPIEFYAACEGHLEKQKDEALIIRFAAFRIAESMVGSKAIGGIEKFWPMEPEKKKKVEPMSKERIEAIFKRHNIKRNG